MHGCSFLGTQPQVLGLGKVSWGNYSARDLPALGIPPAPAEQCCCPSTYPAPRGPSHHGCETWQGNSSLESRTTSLTPFEMFETSS